MRRTVYALCAAALLATAGCKSTQERLSDSVKSYFEDYPELMGVQLCGTPVSGLAGITVTGLTNSGSGSAGTGTATVSATPMPTPGMPAPTGQCSGTVSFSYNTLRTTTGVTRRSRRTTSTLQLYGVMVTNRTGAGAGAAGVPGMPMMPTGMPGMPSGMPMMPSGMPMMPTGMPMMPTAMPGMPMAPAGPATPIVVGGVTTGTLNVGDGMQPPPSGALFDDYSITLTAGVPVTIVTRGGPSMTTPGSNLDVYTILMQNGMELTHDDDSAGNLNSRLIFTPPMTGQYTIRVTTFGSGAKQGMYTLQTMPGAIPTAQ